MKLDNFSQDVIDQYKLQEIATQDGYIYVEVQKEMYGLPQAELLAQELLEKRLAKKGYTKSSTCPGLWKHNWRPITSSLIVDDFGVKYIGKEHADHLIRILQEHNKISEDWSGAKYGGLTLDWDYTRKVVHLSMPGHIDKALEWFQHKTPKHTRRPNRYSYPRTDCEKPRKIANRISRPYRIHARITCFEPMARVDNVSQSTSLLSR